MSSIDTRTHIKALNSICKEEIQWSLNCWFCLPLFKYFNCSSLTKLVLQENVYKELIISIYLCFNLCFIHISLRAHDRKDQTISQMRFDPTVAFTCSNIGNITWSAGHQWVGPLSVGPKPLNIDLCMNQFVNEQISLLYAISFVTTVSKL